MADKFFDLEQAEKLLPQLQRWLEIATGARKELAEIEQEYARMVEDISLLGGRMIDVPHFSRRKQEKKQWISRLQNTARKIEDSGCLLKDLEAGLVDFPCQVDGREVYLCWKSGEPSIQFWHNTDEGFAGRKPVDGKLLEQLKHRRPS